MFSKVGVHMKDKSPSHKYSRVPLHRYPMLEMREDMNQPVIYWQLISQLQVHTCSSPQPAFLVSLGYQRKKIIFSCRTFWPEASLNGAYFGLAFFYSLWDEQPANSADWHWVSAIVTPCFLSLTLFLFSFCSTQLPLILCFYHSILLSQVQLLHFVSCSKHIRKTPPHSKCSSKY